MITLDDIQGHWVRSWIKSPLVEDHDTRVHWMQVGPCFADVRIPHDRPALDGVRALDGLAPAALSALAEAEGFAGRVSLEGTACTWHRAVNWHGVPDAVDVGTIAFDAEGRMVEAGVHADYTELWVPEGPAPARAFELSGAGYEGVLVTQGAASVIGIGWPDKPPTAPLTAALRAGTVPDGAAQLFDGIHALCSWDADVATARLATHPFAEGAPLLEWRGDTLIWHRTDFGGTVRPVSLSVTRVA